ncbi:glycosyltransferase family 2 protein [Massilia sp. TWR1-2-2]|uniref:glycosyltransferase family 2 protein n=1 Tax=Massilia sp. TWR1-2-2 TaxID=2804584 RepID=UPI003CF67EBC
MPSTPANAADAIGIEISVVVPTRGRLDLLDRSLDALTRQDYPAGAYEVIVVDDEPSRNTLQLVAGWRARTLDRDARLVYVANDGAHGLAAARNLGWRSARAPIIAFTNDDTVPATGWLTQAMAAFDAGTDVLCGRVETPTPAPAHRDDVASDSDGAVEFVAANCFCRRRVLEALDGFDERFRDDWREDNDFHFRLLEMNASIVSAPQAVVVHPVRPAAWGASLFQLHKISFDALLYKKHPALYRKKIRRQPCWEDYAIVAALAVGVLGLVVGHEILAVAGWGAWLVLTAMLCIRRLQGSSASVAHVADMLFTSALIPPLAVFWRLLGAIKYRVRFA